MPHLPDYGDPLLRLQRRIRDLETTVRNLQSANNRTSVPIYTPQDLADLVEQNNGELYINSADGKLRYQFNGENKVTSTP